MCMLEILLILEEKTNSNDKKNKEFRLRFFLFYCHFNRNNSAVSVLLPRGPECCDLFS